MRFSLAVLFVLLLARVCYWTEPYGVSVDESTYLAIAEIPQAGGTLYLNAVDRKPPGLFWIYQMVGEVAGPWNIHAVHLLFLGFILGLCLLVYRLSLRLGTSKQEAKLAALLFAVFSSCFPREILSANAEIPMLLFLGAAFLCFDRAQSSLSLRSMFGMLAVGILGGLSVLCKQYAILILVFGFLGLYATRSKGELLSFGARALLASAGGAIVFGATYFYFKSQGAADAFMYYFVRSGMEYVAASRSIQNNATSGLLATLGMIAAWLPLWWTAFVRLKSQWNSREIQSAACAVVGAALTIYLSGRYYTHYFLPLVMGLSLLAAPAWRLLSAKRFGAWTLSGYAALSFGIFLVLNTFRDEVGVKASFNQKRQHELMDVAHQIKELTASTDRIVVWGMASQLYVMSERGSGSRFIFSDFVSGRQPGLASEVSVPQRGAQEEFLDDLYRAQPKIIVDTSGAQLNDYGAFPFERFPKIESYITRHYFKVADAHGHQIWMRSPH